MSPRQTRGYKVSRVERNDYRVEAWPMMLLAFGLINGGLGALFNPGSSASTSVAMVLSEQSRIFEQGWIVAYVIAGAAILVGVIKPWPIMEVCGEWIAAWALSVNLLALLLLRGITGTGTSAGAFLVSISICYVRIHRLHVRARRDRRQLNQPYQGPDRRFP